MEKDFKVYSFYKQMQVNSVILSFKGAVSQDLLSRLAGSLKKKSLKDDPNIGRRIFSIFIELSQNVHLHSAEKSYSLAEDRPIGVGFLLVSEAEDCYWVSSSNLVKKEKVEHINNRCVHINSLDEESLKAFYKEQRRAPQRTDSPGANIGLIEMVRKSNNPLDVQFFDMDNDTSIITLTVKLNKPKILN